MAYFPEDDGSAEDYAAGYRTLADIDRPVSPQLLRPIRSEADARAAVIRARLLRSVNVWLISGLISSEVGGEIVAAIEGATS